MEGSADNKQAAVIVINRVFALLYLLAALAVGYRGTIGEVDGIGSLALVGFFGFQAVGHYQPRLWGPKVTAAVVGAANVVMIGYLLPNYEPHLAPNFETRLIKFVAFTAVTILLVMNYIFCARLFGKKQKPPPSLKGATPRSNGYE